ncbi:MAG: hypothetical protein ACPH8S_06940 [Poseidonia sp.]
MDGHTNGSVPTAINAEKVHAQPKVNTSFTKQNVVELLFLIVRRNTHLFDKGLVIFSGIKFQWNHHLLLAILTLIPLTDHESHVGIDANTVTVDADSKRHRKQLIPLRTSHF